MLVDNRRNDVLAKVSVTVWLVGITAQVLKQEFGSKHINAHRGQTLRWIGRHRLWLSRLLAELDDSVIVVNCHDSEFTPLMQRDRQAGDAAVCFLLNVVGNEFRIVHSVNMIATQDQHVPWRNLLDRVNILVKSVSCPQVPVFVNTLLRRTNGYEFAQFGRDEVPPTLNMPFKTRSLVLSDHENLSQTTVNAIRQREVDNAKSTAKWYRWLAAIKRQRFQSRSLATREYHRKYIVHVISISTELHPVTATITIPIT